MINFIERLLGRKADVDPVRDVAALLAPLAAPAIHATKTTIPSRSHFGGMPNLPPGIAWPEHDGKKLGFLARLSLSELQAACPVDWLPSAGALLFFYDIDGQAWGFDPKDRGSSVTLLVPDLPVAMPEPGSEGSAASIPHRTIAFRRIEVFPSWERESVAALRLNERESDILFDLIASPFGKAPAHQVSGFPNPVQGDDMELECQLVSNGLYCGSPSGYEDVRAQVLKAGAANWRLLFQMDSDDELGVMWGDSGIIYYWVEEHAARAGDFRNTWLILQCG